jgi:hypothetical protein
MALIIGLKSILGWERLPLFSGYGYVEMILCLTIKILPFCRLSTELLVLSVCGLLCSVWRTETFLWRSVHVWKLRQRILSPNMDGHIAYGLMLQLRRDYNCSLWYVILPFSFSSNFETLWGRVHLCYAEAGCMLNVTIITPCKITDDIEARCLVTQFGELAYICRAMTTGTPSQDTATAALGAGTKSPAPPACLLLSSHHRLQCVTPPHIIWEAQATRVWLQYYS